MTRVTTGPRKASPTSETLLLLKQISDQYIAAEEHLTKCKKLLQKATVDAVREARRPESIFRDADVVRSTPWTASYVRILSREAGIEPIHGQRRPKKPTTS